MLSKLIIIYLYITYNLKTNLTKSVYNKYKLIKNWCLLIISYYILILALLNIIEYIIMYKGWIK
jgi:hypothetical protein